jgi:hypothetical protein
VHADIELLRRLGSLRGATIEEVVWRKADRSLRLRIVDMFSNAEGLPEYQGPAPGAVTFSGIDGVTVETALFRGVFRISGIDVDARADGLAARVGLSEPDSDIRLRCKEISVTIGERRA